MTDKDKAPEKVYLTLGAAQEASSPYSVRSVSKSTEVEYTRSDLVQQYIHGCSVGANRIADPTTQLAEITAERDAQTERIAELEMRMEAKVMGYNKIWNELQKAQQETPND